jgi:magnesium-transporting ATPase (P-type)
MMSSFVIFTNACLAIIIRKLTQKENHETYTKYHLSVSIKVSIALLLNTAVIPLLVNFGRESWYNSSGLANDIFYQSISFVMVTPTLQIFNISYFMNLCKQRYQKGKGKNSKLS